MTQHRASDVYAFGTFRLDAKRRLLLSRADGQTVPLSTTAFDTLLYLVEHAGDIVPKATLLRAVWHDVNVEENSLSHSISVVRRALGDAPSSSRFVATVPGRGYRFIAEVAIEATAGWTAADTVASSHVESRIKQRDRSLAVLPFKPLSASGADELLQLGMTDALIMRLGRLPSLELRPLSSVRRFTDLDHDPIEAGRSLGVSSVLDGSLQRDGERLRVSARLLDVANGQQLWADRFDEDLTDTFAIQDTIAERVASAVLDSLTGGERQQLRRHPTDDPQAYQLYVMGWSALTRPSGGNLESALQHLEQAVIHDPNFALAHVCIADCYAMLGAHGVRRPHDMFPKARAALLRALEIDANLPEAHAELGLIHAAYDLDFRRAEIALRRAFEINPRCFLAHRYQGSLLINQGKLDAALASFRRAQALEPLAASINGNIGMVHYFAGRYEEAVAQFQATLEIDGGFDVARGFLGRSLLRLGKFERAIEQFEARTNASAGSSADLVTAYAMSGKLDEARAVLEQLLRKADGQYVSPHEFAIVHAALKNDDAALDWLEQAFEERVFSFIAVDPAFRHLHGQPRFIQLRLRLGLD